MRARIFSVRVSKEPATMLYYVTEENLVIPIYIQDNMYLLRSTLHTCILHKCTYIIHSQTHPHYVINVRVKTYAN